MKAWFLDEGPQAHVDPATFEAMDIHYQALPLDPDVYREAIDHLMRTRGYTAQDLVELTPATPDLDALEEKFVGEHTHHDDEVRFVLEGEGIFDIRDDDDRWMRVEVTAGDLLVVPANRHHRFLLTDAKFIRCVRLFQDPAGWIAHYRDAG
ncbi:MAG: cupin domain-containing protein [Myxococcales bacterium]|nr:cupin domain-containing protein [Myxococcales bacterium]MCB9539518.1 cupin domain-containing protein [Myxococcales bacterium]